MEFYNNKINDNLKFKINAEGIDITTIQPRLVFISENKLNHIIFGKIEDSVCTFAVPELGIYESDHVGNVRFELITEDLYYNVWEDGFKILTKSSVKLDSVITESTTEPIPKINVSQMITEPVKEKKESVKEKKVKSCDKEFKTFEDFFDYKKQI